jgi:hypothetical protein
MSDPLSIPDDKRAGRSRQFVPRSRTSFMMIGIVGAIVIGMNVWFDYHHPLGILFDIILAIVLVVRSLPFVSYHAPCFPPNHQTNPAVAVV